MKKSQLWNKYVAKNPSFDGNGNITMSANGLRKLFHQTWEIAFEAGFNQEFEDDEEDKEEISRNPISSPEAMNIFNTIFGKR